MRLWKLGVIGLLLVGIAWIAGDTQDVSADEKAHRARKSVALKNNQVKQFMRKKLVAADQILEGLTSPDMALVRKGATSMIHMNKEAMWASFKSPSYAQDSADFVRTAERLVKLSKANDLEGASHTYAQLTVQCVNCHRRVRKQGVAQAGSLSAALVAQSYAVTHTTQHNRAIAQDCLFPELKGTQKMKRVVTLSVIATVAALSVSFANSSADEQTATKSESTQKVVVHLSHFTDDLHRCFMALKIANLMQSHGAEVTMFLDLEGVRLAERRQKLDLKWGADAPVLAEHYKTFIEGGGKLVLCPHCAKSARLNDMGLKRMAEIGTMKRIGEMLIEADKVMDY